MTQQSLVSLVVGLAAALVGVLAPVLAHRYSSRDKRENLKRDLELAQLMAEDEYGSRAELMAHIDDRVVKLVRHEKPMKLLRTSMVSGAMFFGCLIGINALAVGQRWTFYLVEVAAYTVMGITILALAVFLISMAALIMSMRSASVGYQILAVLTFPVGAVGVIIVWCIGTLLILGTNLVRQRYGLTAIEWDRSPIAGMKELWSRLRRPENSPDNAAEVRVAEA